MSGTLIKVEGLSKKFCTSLRRSMLYGTYDAVRDMAGISYDAEQLRKNEFWALQDINFELKRGETLGLIGQNGCGKTTLLRLLNGIFPPDKGKITINGRIGALISVGAGFHPYMTGRENIFLNDSIPGMTKSEINGSH
jgi:lipopolysaccharide transport system ATP-binding protein